MWDTRESSAEAAVIDHMLKHFVDFMQAALDRGDRRAVVTWAKGMRDVDVPAGGAMDLDVPWLQRVFADALAWRSQQAEAPRTAFTSVLQALREEARARGRAEAAPQSAAVAHLIDTAAQALADERKTRANLTKVAGDLRALATQIEMRAPNADSRELAIDVLRDIAKRIDDVETPRSEPIVLPGEARKPCDVEVTADMHPPKPAIDDVDSQRPADRAC